MEIKKPYAVVQYNNFIMCVDRVVLYPGYYLFLNKAVKWSKKVVLCLLKCRLVNHFLCTEH